LFYCRSVIHSRVSRKRNPPTPRKESDARHKVLEHLKKHGQLLDFDIAAAINMPLADVRASLTELSARGDISRCSVTSYVKGKAIEGFQCRISGYIPRPAPGRKPGVK
jgi:predicted ArsR family transcriptional regulator